MAEEKKQKKSLQELCEAIYNARRLESDEVYYDFASKGIDDDDVDCQCD